MLPLKVKNMKIIIRKPIREYSAAYLSLFHLIIILDKMPASPQN